MKQLILALILAGSSLGLEKRFWMSMAHSRRMPWDGVHYRRMEFCPFCRMAAWNYNAVRRPLLTLTHSTCALLKSIPVIR